MSGCVGCAEGTQYPTVTQYDTRTDSVARFGCYERIIAGKRVLVCFGCGKCWEPKPSGV